MSKMKKYMDSRYTKISLYVIGTVMICFLLCVLVSMSRGFFSRLFTIIGLVLKPIVAGGVIAYLIEPLIQWIEKRLKFKNARAVAVIGTLVLIILLVISLLFVAVAFISRQVSEIHFSDISDLLANFSDQLNDISIRIQNWFAERSINISSITGKLSNVISGITGTASDIFFALIFSLYFMLDSGRIQSYWDRVRGLFIKPETRKMVREVLQDADHCFSGYIRGQFIDAVLVGVITFIAMLICRVPYAVVIGLLTGLGNLIPYVGPVIGFASLIIVCLIEGIWSKLLVGGIVLAVIMVLDGNVINPKLLSSNIEVHPLLVFVAMIVGSEVGGLIGMLVAVPLAALLKIEFDKFIDAKEARKKAAKTEES